jgi:outer membrane receptor protein involved in Fe transport
MKLSNKRADIKASKSLLAVAVATSLGLMNFGAYAQEENVSEVEDVERISVTGSRLTRTTFDAPTPTVVISAADIKITGAVNINDVLSSMPQFGDGLDSTSGNYSFGNSGINALNLRNLGETRTLVLINGKRPASISDDAQFLYADVGLIPTELVERIEVLTGGASAIYGSDAVAGVVNFIMKKDYEGTSIRAQVGTSDNGGHDTQALTLTHGLNFNDDRGNFTVSVDYVKDSALRQSDRKNSGSQRRSVTNPDNTGPEDGIPDKIGVKDMTTTQWGAEATIFSVWNGADNGYDWYDMTNGDPTLRVPANNQYDGWLSRDGSGFPLDRWGYIEDPFERLTVYSALNYSFDAVDVSFDITYASSESSNTIDPPFQRTWYSYDDLNATFDVPDSVNAVNPNQDWVQLHYTFFEAGPRNHTNEREYLSSNLAISGFLAEDWFWDVSLSVGTSSQELMINNELRNDRLDGNYNAIGPCEADSNCPAFSPFERPSQALLGYVLDSHLTTTDVDNRSLTANIGGDVFELPAGPVQLAVGAEIRYEALKYNPSQLWQSGNISSTKTPMDADRTISEAYTEILVPVISDVTLIKNLDVEMAVRAADYSTESASFTSSKFAVNWAIDDSWRVRSTFSQAVRAPQLTEMFAGQSIGYQTMTDPCDKDEIDGGPSDGRRADNCALLGIPDDFTSNLTSQRGKVLSQGNEELKEEKAETFTVGFIYQPTYFEGFRLSLDYYDIKLEDAIAGFGGNDMLTNCVDLAPNSIDNDFCTQVYRRNDGFVESVNASSLNADQSRRTGIDIESAYVYDNFTFKLVATHQLETSFTEFDVASQEFIKDDFTGQLGSPEWQGQLVNSYDNESFSASWTIKYKQGGLFDIDASEERYDDQEIDDRITHDARAAYDFTEGLKVYLGVNNITDEMGTDHWATSGGTVNGFGILGRTYYLGMNYNF